MNKDNKRPIFDVVAFQALEEIPEGLCMLVQRPLVFFPKLKIIFLRRGDLVYEVPEAK